MRMETLKHFQNFARHLGYNLNEKCCLPYAEYFEPLFSAVLFSQIGALVVEKVFFTFYNDLLLLSEP